MENMFHQNNFEEKDMYKLLSPEKNPKKNTVITCI